MMDYLILLLVFGLFALIFLFAVKQGWVSQDRPDCCVPFDKGTALRKENEARAKKRAKKLLKQNS